MKINNPTLEKVAFTEDQYPLANLKEIALAGRSNVGKSSFVNSMTGRRNLARTSSQPGKTRTINFYNMDEKFRLVDLPGYGYAKASKKDRDKWAEAINTYLETRENLEEIFLVIDFRHSPTALDIQMYEYIKHFGYRGVVIATKADKVKRNQRPKHIKEILKALPGSTKEDIVIYSSEDKNFQSAAWEKITEVIG